MKIKKAFIIPAVCAAMTIAAGVGLAIHKNVSYTKVEEVRADAEINDKSGCIYSDAYNNVSQDSSHNKALITFTGTAHGLADGTVVDDSATLSNILFNGNPLTTYSGSKVVVWGGQNWFFVIYPKTTVKGTTLELLGGLTVGDSVCEHTMFTMNDSGLWKRSFKDAVNSTYASIYDDTYNNTQHATGYNRLMFTYTGVAHNGATLAGERQLGIYDNYISLSGNTLASYAGGSTQIAPWSGQKWIQIIYPETAVSVGSRLVINAGCKIGDAVFEKIIFQLNSSNKWEKLTLIDDDDLVANSDYKLFTINDYAFSKNDGAGFIFFPAVAGSIDAMSNSFGLRFIVNFPEANSNASIKLGGTDIYGTGPIVQITLNFTNNVYLTFNGSIDWSTSIVHTWSVNTDHLVEIYVIHTSDTSCTILLDIDSSLIFKVAKDTTGLVFNNNAVATGTANTASYFSSATDTTALALSRFANRQLKANDISFDNNAETDACKGNEGYYAKAKAHYNNLLTSNQKKAFANDASYSNLRARMVAWAAANGETISFNTTTGELEVQAANGMIAVINKNNAAVIIVVVSMITLSFLAVGAFYLRKRKHN